MTTPDKMKNATPAPMPTIISRLHPAPVSPKSASRTCARRSKRNTTAKTMYSVSAPQMNVKRLKVANVTPLAKNSSASSAGVDALIIHGSPDECRAHIQRYVDNGVDTPVISIMAADPFEAARALAPRA